MALLEKDRKKRAEPLATQLIQIMLLFGVRLVTTVPLFVGLVLASAYTYSICREALINTAKLFQGKIEGTDGLIGALEFVDGLLILTVILLILFGSLQIFVMHKQDEMPIPSGFKGMTSGKLKEKLSSSLVTASAIFLFKLMVQVTLDDETYGLTFWQKLTIWAGFHALYIFAYFIIAQANRLDPHKQPDHHEPEQRPHLHVVPSHDNTASQTDNGSAEHPPAQATPTDHGKH